MLKTTDATTEILELERQFWDALKDGDATTAERLTDDGSILTGAQGVAALSREAMGRMLREATWDMKSYAVDEERAIVRMVTPDVAVVAYPIHENLVVDGQSVTLDANDASVWMRRDGEWLCVLHTESIAGDPFGRDRQPAT